MAIVFRRRFIRPHTDVEFYAVSDEFRAHMQSTYIDTGMCSKFREKTFVDSSKLILQIESVWDDTIEAVDVSKLTDLADHDPLWAAENAKEIEYNAACEIVLVHKELVNE